MNDDERKAMHDKFEEDKLKRQAACKHERTEQEHILGSGTGDYVCVACGKIM